jgi:hypothetical protein
MGDSELLRIADWIGGLGRGIFGGGPFGGGGSNEFVHTIESRLLAMSEVGLSADVGRLRTNSGR